MAKLGPNYIRSEVNTFFPAIDIRSSTGLRIGALCRAHIRFSAVTQPQQPPPNSPSSASTSQFSYQFPILYYNVAADPNATSFNVSIIEQYGVGLYAIRFTNYMQNSDYTAVFNAQNSRYFQNGNRIFFHLRGKSPGEIILETIGGNGETGIFDVADADLMIFTES